MLKIYIGSFYTGIIIEGKDLADIKRTVFDVIYKCEPRARLAIKHGRHCIEGTCRESDRMVEELIGLVHGVSSLSR